ncbi:hypothetical protein SAMN04488516_11717 [Desulfonauticus submarinus]|uniref:Uncharacterized protein n=1 Tax=Desulfonauticus submarinus TaxID=206665 RepID=A0A1H0G9R2_9BACT|nr:hypothetical protein [Desulfonauticus submarinus]SDO03600.1 hypothetical protein SAMN04488516_11717 [Desulfonauticus submarinus]
MARKDQIKLFFCACIDEDPFVVMLKEAKISIKYWPYINALRRWRDKLRDLVLVGVKNQEKQTKTAINKAIELFKRIPADEITIEFYLNFCLALAEDILERVRNKSEKHIWDKIIENMFKLYSLFDPGLEKDRDMEQAIEVNKLVQEVF